MDTETLIAPLVAALKEHHPDSHEAEIRRAFAIALSAHEGQLSILVMKFLILSTGSPS